MVDMVASRSLRLWHEGCSKRGPMIEADVDNRSTARLVKSAAEESLDLLRAETNLAKDELKTELKKATGAAGAAVTALFAGLFAFAALLASLLFAIGVSAAWTMFICGIAMLAVALSALVFGLATAPKRPLPKTRKRIREDLEELGAHGA